MKKIIVGIVIVAVIALGFKFFFKPTKPEVSLADADVILFWGNGCPHCEKVKEYIATNKIDSKLKIALKEVYYDKANQALMAEKAQQCQLDTSKGLGVPFAFIDNKCVIGDQPIIDAINQKIPAQK